MENSIKTESTKGGETFHSFRVKAYREGDAQKMRNPLFDPLSLADLTLLDAVACRSYANTIFYNGQVAAVGGVYYQWKNCYVAWMVVDECITKRVAALYRMCKVLIRHMYLALNATRIEAQVDISKPKNLKWAKALGFVEEFVKRGASPLGTDVYGLVYKGEGYGEQRS